ncbi:MAG: AAA-like domain-containing protein [Cyanobacteria bacterium J06632_22]
MTKTPKRRRKRGVILTPQGLARFQAAKASAEYNDNQGQRYTLEALSERIGLGIDTLAKVLKAESKVDRQTLKYCFDAFALTLSPGDYYSPDAASPLEADAPPDIEPPPPGGQLPIGSPFYLPPMEATVNSFRAIDQPGALVRIRGARRMGKSSLMTRIARTAAERSYRPVWISFQLAENSVLQDLDALLQWFCASVGLAMGQPAALDTYWDSLFGSKLSCKQYFEQYLLAEAQQPVVLLLDDVECLFHYPEVADEFFGLLRTWYEDAKVVSIWQQLRMVIAQTADAYITLNLNKSPFNVGVAVQLPPLTPPQVKTLASTYGLNWSLAEATELCQWVGGQPYLVHLTADYLWRKQMSLAAVLTQPYQACIFSSYLQHQLRDLQHSPDLMEVLSQIVAGQMPPPSQLASVYRLQGMGLIALRENRPQAMCPLYQQYFASQLAS